LGARILTAKDDSLYDIMATDTKNKNAYFMPVGYYEITANRTCDYVVVIPTVHSVPKATFWFRKDSVLYSNFSKA
jgi:hypothetical protein